MIEARALIDSTEKTRISVERLGGIFRSSYSFKDIIFITKNKDSTLEEGFLRLRVYIKRPVKNAILVHKKIQWKKEGKKDIILLKREFITEKQGLSFIKQNLPEFKKGFAYSREGWQYELNNCRIFIEDIESYGPSLEIEAKDSEDLQILFKKIGVKELLHSSVPELMRKILKENK